MVVSVGVRCEIVLLVEFCFVDSTQGHIQYLVLVLEYHGEWLHVCVVEVLLVLVLK